MWSYLISATSVIVLIFLIGYDLRRRLDVLQESIADLRTNQTPDERPTDELTEYELQRLQREEEFDDRIARIKDELANTQQYVMRNGVEAEELHPLVHNLPHDIIKDRKDALPDVEYTD